MSNKLNSGFLGEIVSQLLTYQLIFNLLCYQNPLSVTLELRLSGVHFRGMNSIMYKCSNHAMLIVSVRHTERKLSKNKYSMLIFHKEEKISYLL